MRKKLRPSGPVSPRERIHLVIMVALVAIVLVVVVNGLTGVSRLSSSETDGRLVDPDETAVLPEYDRKPLAGVADGPLAWGRPLTGRDLEAVSYLLGLARDDERISALLGRGFAHPTAERLLAEKTVVAGDFVKVTGRIATSVALKPAGQDGRAMVQTRIDDPDGRSWIVFSAAPLGKDKKAVKVVGMYLRSGILDEASGASGPVPVLVTIHAQDAVMPQRYPFFDPGWVDLALDAEDSSSLTTQAIWYSLAWASTVGSEGLAASLESGKLEAQRMPSSPEISADAAGMRPHLLGGLYRVCGRIMKIHGRYDLEPNVAGLESVYRLRVHHHRGGTKQWPLTILAPRGALPEEVAVGDEIVAEGVYLQNWSTTDENARVVNLPLLIAPRVRHADPEDGEER
jgi:hypothetical protein